MPFRAVSRETSTPFGAVLHSNRCGGRCRVGAGAGSGIGCDFRDSLRVNSPGSSDSRRAHAPLRAEILGGAWVGIRGAASFAGSEHELVPPFHSRWRCAIAVPALSSSSTRSHRVHGGGTADGSRSVCDALVRRLVSRPGLHTRRRGTMAASSSAGASPTATCPRTRPRTRPRPRPRPLHRGPHARSDRTAVTHHPVRHVMCGLGSSSPSL